MNLLYVNYALLTSDRMNTETLKVNSQKKTDMWVNTKLNKTSTQDRQNKPFSTNQTSNFKHC